MNRRTFIGTSAAAMAAPAARVIPVDGKLPVRSFGKTGHSLPVLAMGAAAFIKRYCPVLNVPAPSPEESVRLLRYAFDAGVRYFDTSPDYDESEERCGEALHDIRDKIYLATKANIDFDDAPFDAARVTGSVENSLKLLRTSYLDCVQIHMPHDYDKAMRARDVLDGMRKQGKIRFIGVTNHQNFDVTLRLISTGGFDQALLAYGYFNGGLGRIYSDRSREYRNRALAKAHELGMGTVAMKLMGGTVLGHNASWMVPDYDARKLEQLPAAAIRWVLSDERVQILNIGFSMRSDIDQNVATLRGSHQVTAADRELLADFTSRVYESDAGKSMKMV